VPFVIGLAEVTALTAVGDLSAAERVWRRYAAMAAGAHEPDALVHAMLGLVEQARGALPAACIAFHDSISAMSRGFPSGWLMLVAAWSAQVEGRRGNAEAAAAALRRSEEAYGPQAALFLPELELARAWERAAAGQTSTARMHAARAAQIARRSGMQAVEMRALHTTVRFGDRAHAGRLQELAKTLNTPMSETVAAHAHGLVVHDGVLLDAAADRFAEMGALGLAADATAQAARMHARTGNHGKELAASTRAHWLASKCEIRTPAVNAGARPLPITDREREVAMLVAGGLSNRQIADRLFVSVRTVDGHLYRSFAKLGIERRDQLIHLVNGARSTTSSSG
jgi:ATP/maltotriose-dependent transcriptional regulator MalT